MIHPAAAEGFHGDVYERGRPDYPAEAVRVLFERTGTGTGDRVLDLGAGTGKLTRSLERAGTRVIAVDPLVDMLATMRSTLPAVPAVTGAAEAIPLGSACVQAVFCASAFHWFRHHVALPEIHRVLAPAGGLGLVWNRRDLSVGWVARLWGTYVEPHRGRVPAHDSFEWREVLDTSELFGQVSEVHVTHVQPVDVETLVDRLDSTSFINMLPRPKKDELFAGVREFCATDPDLAGRPVIDIPYRTHVYTARRLG